MEKLCDSMHHNYRNMEAILLFASLRSGDA